MICDADRDQAILGRERRVAEQGGSVRGCQAGRALAQQAEQTVAIRVQPWRAQGQGNRMRNRGQAAGVGALPCCDLGADPLPLGPQAGQIGAVCGTACGQADRQGDAAECVQQRRQVGIVARDGVRNVEEQGARLGVGQGIDAVTQCPAGAAHGFLAAERGEHGEAGDGGEDGEAGLDRRAGAFPRGFQVVEDQQGGGLRQALGRGGKALGWGPARGRGEAAASNVSRSVAVSSSANQRRWPKRATTDGWLAASCVSGGLADAAWALDQHGGGIGRAGEGGDDAGGVVRAAKAAVGDGNGCAFWWGRLALSPSRSRNSASV